MVRHIDEGHASLVIIADCHEPGQSEPKTSGFLKLTKLTFFNKIYPHTSGAGDQGNFNVIKIRPKQSVSGMRMYLDTV